MPPTLDATPGGASANSFIAQADATTYLDGLLNTDAWTNASSADKDRALIAATRWLSALGYGGSRSTSTQALSWPRLFAANPDVAGYGWAYYSTTIVPARVQNATCKLALEFLNAGTTDISGQEPTVGIIEKTVDVLTTRYADPGQRPQGLRRFPQVWIEIAPLLDYGTQGNSTEVIRG